MAKWSQVGYLTLLSLDGNAPGSDKRNEATAQGNQADYALNNYTDINIFCRVLYSFTNET